MPSFPLGKAMWAIVCVRSSLGERPIPVAEGPVPPLRRVVDQADRLQGGGEDLAMDAGVGRYVRGLHVAGAVALLRVVVDLGAHVVLRAVGRAERQVDGGSGGVRGHLDWRHIPTCRDI